MKNKFADAIMRGSAHYKLRYLIKELKDAISEDEDMKDRPTFFYLIYSHIIHMLALGHDAKDITYFLKNLSGLELDDKAIRFHIKNAKSKYKDFIELMEAIYCDRYRDFLDLGASEDEAVACFNDWITSELT